MANFSAAFGYSFYIMPLAAADVDVTSVPSAANAADFLDTTSVYAADSTVAYSAGVFTVGGNAFNMDGAVDDDTPADQPVKLLGLTNAALETDTSSEDIYTYDDETKGFNQSVATTKSFSISLAGVADFADAGYQVLRLTEQNTVADALRVKFVRVGPTGSTEAVFGYGTLTGYTESNEVSSIVSWECTLTGYGAYGLDLQ
jgi:hypothetical protein